MSVKIRPIAMNDFPAWLPLWDGNNNGVRDEEVTATLWSRLMDPDFGIYAFVAEDNKGELVGMVQYVVHHVTGAVKPVCYMQDVYVDPAHRQKGIARKLVMALTKKHKAEQQWRRMYWLAETDNEAAQKLYEKIGVKLNFTLHVLMA